MRVSRRTFLLSAATVAGSTAARAAGNGNQAPSQNGFGILVDTTYCVGCRRCELGCNQANDVPKHDRAAFDDKSVFGVRRRPSADALTVVNQVGTAADTGNPIYFKIQCLHCQQPACASACIVGALRKQPEGPVTYDADKCIGCRYCMIACPFQIPAYEYADAFTPRVQKCSFCYERIVHQGLRPACVENCPNEALTFGRREELLRLAHGKLMAEPQRYNGRVFGEHDGGGTSWLVLSKLDFAALDLPDLGDSPPQALTESIQHSVFRGFVPPLALYGLLGLVYWSRRREEVSEAKSPKKAGDDHG